MVKGTAHATKFGFGPSVSHLLQTVSSTFRVARLVDGTRDFRELICDLKLVPKSDTDIESI